MDNESEDEADPEDLCRPSAASMNLFCPNVECGNIISINPPAEAGIGDGNPLFAPFPMQGKPLISVDALAEDGFKLSEKKINDS